MAGTVIVEVFAGLGNQLFQFAAGYGLARLAGSDVEVFPIPGGEGRQFALDKFAIDLRFARQGTLRQRIENRLARHAGIRLPGLFRETGFPFDERVLKLRPPVRLRGYFQSERYFAHVAGDIRRMMSLRQPLSPTARQVAAEIDGTPQAVSVHVRRGDYATGKPGIFHALDPDYYRRATRLLEALLGAEPRYFIFSDEPDRADSDLGFLSNRRVATAGLDRPEEDLVLMSRCRHHVIANSTFSWWGAWLGSATDKLVVAPRQWFTPAGMRRENTCDLIPAGWILL